MGDKLPLDLLADCIFKTYWQRERLAPTFSNAFPSMKTLISNQISLEFFLTHWGRVMHICISDLTIIGSDNGLLPGRRQAIIWTNAELLLNGPLGTNFSEILIEILSFSFKKMCLKVSSAKWSLFCLGLNVLKDQYVKIHASWGLNGLQVNGINPIKNAPPSFNSYN